MMDANIIGSLLNEFIADISHQMTTNLDEVLAFLAGIYFLFYTVRWIKRRFQEGSL